MLTCIFCKTGVRVVTHAYESSAGDFPAAHALCWQQAELERAKNASEPPSPGRGFRVSAETAETTTAALKATVEGIAAGLGVEFAERDIEAAVNAATGKRGAKR
jgi:hypothetical protein